MGRKGLPAERTRPHPSLLESQNEWFRSGDSITSSGVVVDNDDDRSAAEISAAKAAEALHSDTSSPSLRAGYEVRGAQPHHHDRINNNQTETKPQPQQQHHGQRGHVRPLPVLSVTTGSYALPHPFKGPNGVAMNRRNYGPKELCGDISVMEGDVSWRC